VAGRTLLLARARLSFLTLLEQPGAEREALVQGWHVSPELAVFLFQFAPLSGTPAGSPGQRMVAERIIAETGAGQHGVATATVCRASGWSALCTWGPGTWSARR